MSLSVEDCLAAIESHTRGLAAAAEGRFERRIEHCPDWTMADLVWHVAQVHWFWSQVALNRPTEAPEDFARPERPAQSDLLATLLTNMTGLVETLRGADQSAPCWTWGLEENVWFITRHQVQEAAIHHWDAVNAAGTGSWGMDTAVAMDAVDEFLTHSVANRRWPAEHASPLDGTLWFCACEHREDDLADSWHVEDGEPTGTLAHRTWHLPEPAPEVAGAQVGAHGDAPSFLLWLYQRVDLTDRWHGDTTILDRFRSFTNTD